jgi:hypothetical protein
MAQPHPGKFSISPDVMSERMLDETLLLNKRTLQYVRLDHLAGDVWALLEEHEEIETVIGAYQQRQDMPRDQAEKFVNGCIAGFRRAGLIALEP